MVYFLTDSQTMKIYCSGIGILFVTSILFSTVLADVTKCFVCPTNYGDAENIKACQDPFDEGKKNGSEFECSSINDLLKETTEAPTEASTAASGPATDPAPPPDPLMEWETFDASSPWKCYKITGTLNGTSVTSRGCTKSCDQAKTGLADEHISVTKCEECNSDLCNSSDRFNPIGSTSFLLIVAICFGLQE